MQIYLPPTIICQIFTTGILWEKTVEREYDMSLFIRRDYHIKEVGDAMRRLTCQHVVVKVTSSHPTFLTRVSLFSEKTGLSY